MNIQQRVALQHHLSYNVFPPCPAVVPFARAAIEQDGEGDITFPDGTVVSAAQLIEDLRLEFFLEGDDADV